MSQLIVVFGVTGQQGGSVVNSINADPELSKKYKIRGVTRDPSKPAAQALQQKGVEVVAGDLNDEASIKAALEGAHTIFFMTHTIYEERGKEKEYQQCKTVADAAVAAGAQLFIFSTEVHASKVSGGKYTVDSYDVKADAEQYIRGLPIKSSFFAPGAFMQNLGNLMPIVPTGDGSYSIFNIMNPDAAGPWVDIADDTGKFVGAILADPDKYEGKFLSASSCIHSMEEVVQIISRVTGKTVRYNQIPESKFRGFLPPETADTIVNMFLFIQDFGYYGPQTREEVEWTAKQARGQLSTLEEYVSKNVKLE